MDRLCPLNCNLELKRFLVIQLVSQMLNYAKSHTWTIRLYLIGVYVQDMWESRGRESGISHPLKEQCRHTNLSMAKPHWREPGGNQAFLTCCVVLSPSGLLTQLAALSAGPLLSRMLHSPSHPFTHPT